MSINGKRDNFSKGDLLQVGNEMNIKSSLKIVDEIIEIVAHWPDYALTAGIDEPHLQMDFQFHLQLHDRHIRGFQQPIQFAENLEIRGRVICAKPMPRKASPCPLFWPRRKWVGPPTLQSVPPVP